MKVGILAGGRGTRLTEEMSTRPKPVVEIGSRPILWHIMSTYAAHDVTDFVIACEIREQYLDCTKAKRVLGWQPHHSLEDGLHETVAWYEGWLGGAQKAEPLTVTPA